MVNFYDEQMIGKVVICWKGDKYECLQWDPRLGYLLRNITEPEDEKWVSDFAICSQYKVKK